MQKVKPALDILYVRAFGDLHRFVYGQTAGAFLVTLPRSAVVAAKIAEVVVTYFLGDLVCLCHKSFLIESAHIPAAEFVPVHLIAARYEDKRKVFFFGKFQRRAQ